MTRWTSVIGLVLCGCAPLGVAVATLNPGENLGPSENLAAVVGRIIQVENGKEQNMRNFWQGGEPGIALYRVETGQWFGGATVADKDGNVYWLLPRGTYLMAQYRYRVLPMEPQTALQIPPGPAVVYIGTLRIEIDTVSFLGPARKGPGRFAVLDEFEQARTALEIRNPQLAHQVAKHLMVHSLLLLPAAPIFGSLQWHTLVGVLNELGLPILTTAH